MTVPAFSGVPTIVGSFPHTDPEPLVETLLRRLPDMPAWPQLPARDFRESMCVQCAEGLPGAVIHREGQRLFFRRDGAFAGQLESFHQALAETNLARFAITRAHAAGLHRLLDSLRASTRPRRAWVKGQLAGPFTFAQTVTDESGRPLAHTPELCQVAVLGLTMKARWMARALRAVADGALVVIDEPSLCSLGSAVAGAARPELLTALNRAAAAIHAEGAMAGLHCCADTDWSLVLATDLDLVSFDAHEYFQGLALHTRELAAFVERGGVLSWGIVPTSAAAVEIGAHGLVAELDGHLAELERQGIARERLLDQALLTPACGLGTRTVAAAEQVLDVLTELAALWQRRREAG